MTVETLSTNIASVPDREDIVFEIFCGDTLFAEISFAESGALEGKLQIAFYKDVFVNKDIILNFEEFLEILQNARDRLR